MKFSKNLKIMFSGLILAPFMAFSVVNANKNVNQTSVNVEQRTDVDKNGCVLFTRADGTVDNMSKLVYHNIQDNKGADGFVIDLVCDRNTSNDVNTREWFSKLAQEYIDSRDSNNSSKLNKFKLVVKKLNGEIVYETNQFNYFATQIKTDKTIYDHINNSCEDIVQIEDGTYNVELYNGDGLLGSFKNVKFERTM